MSRAKRKRDHERMLGRAWDCGIEGRVMRIATGRMNQTIARLKKQLALEQKRYELLQMDVKSLIEDLDLIISATPESFDAYWKYTAARGSLSGVLADSEEIKDSDSVVCNQIEENIRAWNRSREK